MRFNMFFAPTPKHETIEADGGTRPLSILRLYMAAQLTNEVDSPWLFTWVYAQKLQEGKPQTFTGRDFFELFRRPGRKHDFFADPSQVRMKEVDHFTRMQKLAQLQIDMLQVENNGLMDDDARVASITAIMRSSRDDDNFPDQAACPGACEKYGHLPLLAKIYDMSKVQVIAKRVLAQSWRHFRLASGEHSFRERLRHGVDDDMVTEFENQWLDRLRNEMIEELETHELSDDDVQLMLRGLSHRQGGVVYMPAIVLATTHGVKELQAPTGVMYQYEIDDLADTPFAFVGGAMKHARNITSGSSFRDIETTSVSRYVPLAL